VPFVSNLQLRAPTKLQARTTLGHWFYNFALSGAFPWIEQQIHKEHNGTTHGGDKRGNFHCGNKAVIKTSDKPCSSPVGRERERLSGRNKKPNRETNLGPNLCPLRRVYVSHPWRFRARRRSAKTNLWPESLLHAHSHPFSGNIRESCWAFPGIYWAPPRKQSSNCATEYFPWLLTQISKQNSFQFVNVIAFGWGKKVCGRRKLLCKKCY